MVLLSLVFTVVATSTVTGQWSTMNAADRAAFQHDTIGLILQPPAQIAQLAICVLGALLMASEFSTGMIRATTLATPRRTPVLMAKATVFALLVFLLAEAVAWPAVLIGSSITRAHASVGIGDPATVRAALSFGLYMSLTGLVALAVGTLIRHPAAAIAVLAGLQFVLPVALSQVSGSVGEHLAGALPAGAVAMLGSGHDAGAAYSPVESFLILLAWAAALLTVAGTSFKKRNL
ncbi:hypothetical protein GCM10009665_48400 [Kitasatospora nipponensis]|uniref:ABC transporter permease n=2 Tax=Kitasatospora nipponensis TaxID=258049 RepID=A0ABN1WIX5_9ACTN